MTHRGEWAREALMFVTAGSVAAVISGALFGAACGGGREAEAPREEEPVVEAPPAEPRERWEDPSFELTARASGPYARGQEGRFEIVLTPRGQFHVNTEYPMTVRLSGPDAVEFARDELGAHDAAELAEPRARFSVPFVASAEGQHQVIAAVDFAVCTPESCMPDSRTLAVMLPVGGAQPAEAPPEQQTAQPTAVQ